MALFGERHCLLVVADAAVEDREVVERHAHVRVPLAQDLLPHHQRLFVHGNRLVVLPLVLVQHAVVVEQRGDRGVVRHQRPVVGVQRHLVELGRLDHVPHLAVGRAGGGKVARELGVGGCCRAI